MKSLYAYAGAAVLAGALCTTLVFAQQAKKSGIDKEAMDTSCKPCDDFYQYVNGAWLSKNPIPARYSNWGTFTILSEGNRERTKVILEAAALSKAAPGSDERRIGDLYASCMDTGTINALGSKPAQPYFDRIAKISTPQELATFMIVSQKDAPSAPFGFFGGMDLKNSKEVIGNVGAGGLSLPDRDYYFNTDERTKKIREEFLAHVQRTFELLGETPETAKADAQTVLNLETKFAQATMTRVQRRDPYARYHKMDAAGVAQIAPAFDWNLMLKQFNLPETTPINVSEPEFMKVLQAQLTETPLDSWKTWLRWRTANSTAPLLSQPFFDENFKFSSVLTGTKEQLPRWQTCSAVVDNTLGDALGRVFVQKHFPPEAKQQMMTLVENLRATLREELQNADWLSPETKQNAIAKLNAFTPKIGYAEKWRDYSNVKTDPKTYFANVRGASLNNRMYQLSKIGKPVDRKEFGMTPPTVNAYYSPPMNEIAFPAGILQPPFFDMTSDEAVNYGAIGAVIGHEMGHGFDDQGSKFDAEGNLKNWWTTEDRKKFEERANCVIDQFNTMDVGEGLKHNGKLVVGEAIGDIGGLTLAYKAYHRSLNGKPAPVIDGFTGDQRFFIAFARVWARNHTPEDLRLRLNTDPHPIAKFRAIGTLQNMPEFQKAFNCKPSDPMVRAIEKQCRLW